MTARAKTATDESREAAVLSQLQRIENSAAFAKAPVLRKLLRHIVEVTLAAREPNGRTIAADILGEDLLPPKTESHSKVRVYVGRLRDRLGKYYASEGKADPVIISIPVGSYTSVFDFITQKDTDHQGPEPSAAESARRIPKSFNWRDFILPATAAVVASFPPVIVNFAPALPAALLIPLDFGASFGVALAACAASAGSAAYFLKKKPASNPATSATNA